MAHGRDPGSQRLVGAVDAVTAALEELLAYVRAADGLLRASTGRIGPALLGGIEAAADHLRDRERRLEAALGPAGRAGSQVTLAGTDPGEPSGAGALADRGARLRGLIAELDQAVLSLRRAYRRPISVPPAAVETACARTLLHDALDQGLEELVPPSLRARVSALGDRHHDGVR